MTSTSKSIEQDVSDKTLLDNIFDYEAKMMLSVILNSTKAGLSMFMLSDEKYLFSLAYIKSVLWECSLLGHLNVFMLSDEFSPTKDQPNRDFHGYAMVFSAPGFETAYLHHIVVKDKYQKQGFGGQLMKQIICTHPSITLVCNKEMIPFYEKYALTNKGLYNVPDGDNFKLSRGLYNGLHIMSLNGNPTQSLVFMLNDNDLKKMTFGN
jgi:GNAT superfamily N-acetyltransferase